MQHRDVVIIGGGPAGRVIVHTQSGQSYDYRHLVLVTGSRPLVPPIPGVGLAGVTPVRSLKDLDTLRGFAAAGQKAVIVGGGYIGIEVAVVLRQMGLEVDVVEMLPQILMATTEPEFIKDVEKTLDAEGVGLVTNRKVAEFRNKNGRGVDVKLENGETLPADFAVLSVGVVPNVELAAKPSDNTYVFAARDAMANVNSV